MKLFIKKLFFSFLVLSSLDFVYACMPAPGAVFNSYKGTKEEYEAKINSPFNFFEFPEAGPMRQGDVSTYQILKDSKSYSLFWLEPGGCFQRGLYVKNTIANIVVILMYLLCILIMYISIVNVSVKKVIPKIKATFFVLLYFFILLFMSVFLFRYPIVSLFPSNGSAPISKFPGMLLIYSLPIILVVSSLRSAGEKNSLATVFKKIISVIFILISLLLVNIFF